MKLFKNPEYFKLELYDMRNRKLSNLRMMTRNEKKEEQQEPTLKAQVDLNRNFPVGFGLGADDLPCSEVYKGQVRMMS